MAEELALSMCFIVQQQSFDIISDVGEPEGAVWDHFVINGHHNGIAAEAVEALVRGVLDLFALQQIASPNCLGSLAGIYL